MGRSAAQYQRVWVTSETANTYHVDKHCRASRQELIPMDLKRVKNRQARGQLPQRRPCRVCQREEG
jgi:hypothetical protein